jgi:hypothetical protein
MESSNTTKLPFYRFLLIKCPVILLIKVIFFMLVDQIHLKVHLLVSKIEIGADLTHLCISAILLRDILLHKSTSLLYE